MWPGAGAPVVLGPAPGVPRVLYCVLHCVLCCALHCVPHCVLRCVLHCVLCCVLCCVRHCVLRLHCVLCSVLHPVVHCVLHSLCYALHCVLCCVLHCVLHCALCCVLRPVVLCVLHAVVHCALHPVAHCVLHPVVYCVPCSVLAGHVHCRGAVCCALHAVLVMHPGAVHRSPFPVPLHPALPALWGGGGVRDRNGGGVACPPVPAGQPKCRRKHLAAPVRLSLVGKEGGGHLSLPGAAGSLCAHVGTRAPRRGRARAPAGPAAAVPTSGRAARASPAPAALRTPVWPAPAMPRARWPRLAGRRCQHLPGWCPSLLGGRLPRRRVPLVPRAAAPADSPAQLQAAAARGRALWSRL